MSLFRLEGGREKFDFDGVEEGTKIAVFAHHPTSEEIAAALAEAGVDLQSAQKVESASPEGLEAAARFGAAYEVLGAYCIDSCDALKVRRVKGPYGLRKLDEASEEQLAPILRQVGQSLYEKSKPSPVEGEG